MCELFSTFQLNDTNLEEVKIIEMSQMKAEFREKRPNRINSGSNRNRESHQVQSKNHIDPFLD